MKYPVLIEEVVDTFLRCVINSPETCGMRSGRYSWHLSPICILGPRLLRNRGHPAVPYYAVPSGQQDTGLPAQHNATLGVFSEESDRDRLG